MLATFIVEAPGQEVLTNPHPPINRNEQEEIQVQEDGSKNKWNERLKENKQLAVFQCYWVPPTLAIPGWDQGAGRELAGAKQGDGKKAGFNSWGSEPRSLCVVY